MGKAGGFRRVTWKIIDDSRRRIFLDLFVLATAGVTSGRFLATVTCFCLLKCHKHAELALRVLLLQLAHHYIAAKEIFTIFREGPHFRWTHCV